MRGRFDVRPRHPMAGRSVVIKLHTPHPMNQIKDGDVFVVEDWLENVGGKRWTVEVIGGQNSACMLYAHRAVKTAVELHDGFEPVDDVVYGKVGPLGHVIHNSEIVSAEPIPF